MKRTFKDLWWELSWWWDDHIEKFLVGFIVLLFAVFVWLAALEHQQWEEFAVQHKCRVVGRTEGRWIVGSDGKSYYESGQTGYLCDDGVTYWR